MVGVGVADANGAVGERVPAEDGAQEGAFAGAVRAEDGGEAAAGDGGGDVVQGQAVAVGDGDVFEAQDVMGGGQRKESGLGGEGVDDEVEVVAEEGEVGFAGRSGGAEAVGVERADDADVGFAGDEFGDFGVGGSFDEDGGDVFCADESDELSEVASGRFLAGNEAGDGDEGEIVGVAEVAEGVVGSDEFTAFGREGGEVLAGEGVEGEELLGVGGGAFGVEGGVVGGEEDEGVAEVGHVSRDVAWVLPGVGVAVVVVVVVTGGAGALEWGDAVAGGDEGAAKAGLGDEALGEPGFVAEAVDDKEVGAGEEADVGGAGFEVVGIDAWGYEGAVIEGIARDLADEIVKDGVGGDDEGAGGGGNGGKQAKEKEEGGTHGERKEVHSSKLGKGGRGGGGSGRKEGGRRAGRSGVFRAR